MARWATTWAGVWIAEDIELTAVGIRSDSWVDRSLGVVSAGLDGLALISDPVPTRAARCPFDQDDDEFGKVVPSDIRFMLPD
jgi:hypothetical protein